MGRIRHFFERFTRPKVEDREIEGVKHVIDNIDEGFDPERPRPEAFERKQRDDEERV